MEWSIVSKNKKKKFERPTSVSETDIKFEKIIQFSGWIFLLVLAGFLGGWALLDLLNLYELYLEVKSFTFIIFSGVSSAFCFGLATRIKNNRDQKRQLFLDWMLAEFMFCLFAILAISVYQW